MHGTLQRLNCPLHNSSVIAFPNLEMRLYINTIENVRFYPRWINYETTIYSFVVVETDAMYFHALYRFIILVFIAHSFQCRCFNAINIGQVSQQTIQRLVKFFARQKCFIDRYYRYRFLSKNVIENFPDIFIVTVQHAKSCRIDKRKNEQPHFATTTRNLYKCTISIKI
jgi:hypothetical protein